MNDVGRYFCFLVSKIYCIGNGKAKPYTIMDIVPGSEAQSRSDGREVGETRDATVR
jgi:hypothetical protein